MYARQVRIIRIGSSARNDNPVSPDLTSFYSRLLGII